MEWGSGGVGLWAGIWCGLDGEMLGSEHDYYRTDLISLALSGHKWPLLSAVLALWAFIGVVWLRSLLSLNIWPKKYSYKSRL